MDNITRFIKTSVVFFLGNILSKLVSILLLPIYTSKLLPEQYGEYDLVITLVNLFTPVAFFQIWDGMYRYAFDYKNAVDKYYVINNSIIVSFFGGGIYIAISYIGYLYFNYEYPIYVLIFGLLCGINYLVSFVCRLFLKNILFVTSGIINSLVSAISCIILILVFNWDVKALYLSLSLGSLFQIIWISKKLNIIKYFKIKDYNRRLCRNLFSFSIPLCIATISYWLLSGYTKLGITNSLGLEDNGYYAVANRFATMITIFVSIFQYAWNEISYIMSVDENRKYNYSFCVDLLYKTVIFGSSIVCILVKLIFPYFIGSNYYGAISIIPITIYGVAFNCIAGFIGTLFMTEKNTKHILYSTLIAASVNIILCTVLTKYYGLYGATLSLSLAFLLLMVLRIIQLMKYLSVKVNIRLSLFLFFFVSTSYVFHYNQYIYLDTLYIIILCILYIISIRDLVKILKRRYVNFIN